MRAIDIDHPVRGFGAFLVACVVLAAAGCRPDYAKLESSTPAELVVIMRSGWWVNAGAAGAELSTLAMRKPDLVRPVAGEIHELLQSPYPETRRWATCVLLRIDRFREDVTASARVMLSDRGEGPVATESRSKVLYHLATNPFVLHECRDLVVRALSDEDLVVVDAALECVRKDAETYSLDDAAAVRRLVEICRTNRGSMQGDSLDALSRVTPRLRATVAQGLSTVTVLPGNEKCFAAAVEATSRREDDG